MTAIYTITSGLHNENEVSRLSDEFLSGIFPDGGYEFRGSHFQDFGTHTLDIIYVRTGGAEGIFKSLLPEFLSRGIERYYLLTSGKSNSLAASLEILSYLNQQGLKGEVLHGTPEYLRGRIGVLETVALARQKLSGSRIGVIGEPSDWLISSHADPVQVMDRIGARLESIPMEELLKEIASSKADEAPAEVPMADNVRASYPGATQVYHAVPKSLAEGANSFSFDLFGTDGINQVKVAETAAQGVYTLSGVRVNAQKLQKGIYIVNGKKMVIK